MGVNTGTNRSRGGLLVQDNNTTTPEDTVFAYGVREIIVTTGTLTNNGQGTVTITTGGGSGSGSVTSVATAGTVNGLTLTGGTITVAGTITLGGTLAINNADWSGTALSATNGGTGLTTYTTGDIIYSSAANTLSKLGIGSAGEVLTVSAGVFLNGRQVVVAVQAQLIQEHNIKSPIMRPQEMPLVVMQT